MAKKKEKTREKETCEELPSEELEKEEVLNNQEEEIADAEEKVSGKDELTLALEKAAELNDKYLRLQAEFDNYRKRTLKEKMEMTKTAGENIIIDILPVMDDFERAMTTLDSTDEIKAVKEGLHLIYNKFEGFLKQKGVHAIATDGEFNTELHEAVTQIPAPSEEQKGRIMDCIQRGYVLNEKVIRHSKVVVGA